MDAVLGSHEVDSSEYSSLLIFDFLLPIAFIITCWKYRKSFFLPEVQVYFGTLFENFNHLCFWWELVVILKKLAIALTLQGIPSSNSSQSAIIMSILSIVLATQVRLLPWRRNWTENLSDTVSTLLLIFALVFTRPYHGTNAVEIQYYVLALSAAFVLCSLSFIVFHTITDTTAYELQLARHLSINETGLDKFAVNGSIDNESTNSTKNDAAMSDWEDEPFSSPIVN